MDEKELKTAESAEETEISAEQAEVQEENAGGTAEVTETASVGNAAEKKIDWYAEIVDILETMLLSVFSILLIFAYLMRPVTVEGSSMVPTLYNQDKLVMYRLFYQPKAGDVVVVSNYAGHLLSGDTVVESGASFDECIIKRVIAVGGQKIDIVGTDTLDEYGNPTGKTYRVYVDDVLLDEPFINETMWKDDGAFTYPITIPEGYVFVMGDNRNHSSDSRSIYVGLVDAGDVMGKAYFRYQPAKDKDTGVKYGNVGFIR